MVEQLRQRPVGLLRALGVKRRQVCRNFAAGFLLAKATVRTKGWQAHWHVLGAGVGKRRAESLALLNVYSLACFHLELLHWAITE